MSSDHLKESQNIQVKWNKFWNIINGFRSWVFLILANTATPWDVAASYSNTHETRASYAQSILEQEINIDTMNMGMNPINTEILDLESKVEKWQHMMIQLKRAKDFLETTIKWESEKWNTTIELEGKLQEVIDVMQQMKRELDKLGEYIQNIKKRDF